MSGWSNGWTTIDPSCSLANCKACEFAWSQTFENSNIVHVINSTSITFVSGIF